MQLRPIELLTNAYEKKLIKVEFEIPLGDSKSIPAVLTAPDVYSILEVQEEEYQGMYARYCEKGYDKKPVNEADWKKELAGYTNPETRKRVEDDKPTNLADQIAKKFSKIRTVHELIPRFLKNKDGKPLFETSEERAAFKGILCSDSQLMNLLAQKYLELTGKMAEVTDEVKNLSEPVGLESGSSKKQ